MKNKFSRALSHRFGPVLLFYMLFVLISFVTRISLLILSAHGFDWTVTNIAGSFGIGMFYDLAAGSFVVIPMILHLWFMNDRSYESPIHWVAIGTYCIILFLLLFTHVVPRDFNGDLYKVITWIFILRFAIYLFLYFNTPQFRLKWRTVILSIDFLFLIYLLLFNAVSEIFFWDEFSVRYNFIAVDYLVYTNEVLGNIRESYPLVKIILGVLALTIIIFLGIRKYLRNAIRYPQSFGSRSVTAICLLVLPLLTALFVTNKGKKFSQNEYANELAGNGIFDFATAFRNNELDFFKFYKTIPDTTAFRILREQLAIPNAQFLHPDPYSIERKITAAQPQKKLNVVLISVESLSGDFMRAFGSTKNITPNLDSLAKLSLFFTNFYASGTRTVRGLEALSLCMPPTPGQSVVKRPGNENLFSLSSVFHEKGYSTQFMYGGYGYFDNMNYYFSHNNYQVIDRTALQPGEIHYENIWGVADEDLFDLSLRTLDSNYASGKLFFTQIMTVSNHRPYTYPDDRIDIPPSTQSRDGAVKYTDYAIGRFLRDAQKKPWFNNTIFVIVADHCAGSAGSVQLPLKGYHIPLLIYSPANLQPKTVDRLMAQVDLGPTILGLLNFSYNSKFFGQDIFSLPEGRERAFISTYQGLGYYRDGRLVIQSPVKQVKEYLPDLTTGKSSPVPLSDSLELQAISFYQCASWLIKHNAYKQ